MKVALISLARRGGMVHYQQELAKSLVHLMPVVVICARDVPASYFPRGAPRFVVDVGRGPWSSLLKASNPLNWYRMARLVRSLGADVFHVVAPHEWNPIVAFAVRMAGKPLVYTVHDPIKHRGAPLRMWISNALLVRLADALVVLTRHGYACLADAGVQARRLFLIPMMAHLAFVQGARSRGRSRNVFLFFGRIEPYKGLEVLLRAFERVRAQLSGWGLVIAGVAPRSFAAARKPSPGITLLDGYVPDQDVARIMKEAAVVVLPYLEATQSGVIAIAAALGRPVIVTRVGGLPEMVIPGKTGLIVRPNDVRALARAMVTLARDPARRKRMGQAARSLARSRWSPGAIAQQHVSMYSTVVGASWTE